MNGVFQDRAGRSWALVWGVANPDAELRDTFSCAGPFQPTGQTAHFSDPRYPAETRALQISLAADGRTVGMAEISPGVYTVGILKSQAFSEEREFDD